MSLTRWNRGGGRVSLRDAMNQLFEDSWLGPSMQESGDRPEVFVPLSVYETEDQLVISAPLPGMSADDVDISVVGDTLTIKGEFEQDEEEQRGTVHVRERSYGSFVRRVRLPSDVDTENIEATFENGMLKLTAPKMEEAKPKRIEIKSGQSAQIEGHVKESAQATTKGEQGAQSGGEKASEPVVSADDRQYTQRDTKAEAEAKEQAEGAPKPVTQKDNKPEAT